MRVSLLFLFLFSSLYTTSQISDIEVFSEEAVPFRFWLNGIEKTTEPVTHLECVDLSPGYYEAMVVIPTRDDTLTKPLSFSPNSITTFVLKEKRKGFVLRYRDETPLSIQEPIIASTNSSPSLASNKTQQAVRVNPNCPQATGGLDKMETIRLQLVNIPYDETKLQEAKHLLQGECFYSLHLVNLLAVMQDDVYRLELAKTLLHHTVDIDQAYLYARTFSQDHFQQSFLDAWENNR